MVCEAISWLPVLVSKKLIVSPAIAEDNWTAMVAVDPTLIVGEVEPAMVKVLMDCVTVVDAMSAGDEELIQTKAVGLEAALLAQVPEPVTVTVLMDGLRLFKISPAKTASII